MALNSEASKWLVLTRRALPASLSLNAFGWKNGPLVLFNVAGVAYKFAEWARSTARPGLMTASLIRRAGAWSREPCRAGRLVPRKLWAEFCRLYWRPLCAFARRRGRSPEDAQVQGFFEHLIGSRRLATVERSTGRFRSFVLASFQSFITAENRPARAETVKILIPRPPKSFCKGSASFLC